MAAAFTSLSHVKLNFQEIISNLELLESSDCMEPSLSAIRTNTEELLRNLENLPLESLNSKIKKRQKRRKYKKLKRQKNMIDINFEAQPECEKLVHAKLLNISPKPIIRPDQQIEAIKECQRFLKTFELLQQLHLVRGQNPSETYKFSLKLRQLKLIWNSLLQDKLQEQTSEDVKIQEQWNEVLFGPSEKIYFEEKPNVQDFIKKRQVWDSYIDNRYGSSIPTGWVTPPLKVNKRWRTYMSPETF